MKTMFFRRMAGEGWLLILLLTALLSLTLAARLLLRCLLPAAVLPQLDIPDIALLSLTALMIDRCAAAPAPETGAGGRRSALLLAPLCFLLLPLAAGESLPAPIGSEAVGLAASLAGALGSGLLGGAVFDLLTLAFDSLMTRPGLEASGKMAPLVSAICLLCATQAFAGMLL